MKRLLSLAVMVFVLAFAVMAQPAAVDAVDTAGENIAKENAHLSASVVDSGTCGENLTWTLDSAGTLTISGTGKMEAWDINVLVPWYDYIDLIKKIVISEGVANIEALAFHNCRSLTSVSIPDSVTNIGNDAFYECISLERIKISKNVKNIAHYAFLGCTKLQIIVDDNNEYYSSLDGVLFNKDKTVLIQANDRCVSPHYVIPEGVTDIGYSAFSYCASLIDISIPNSVTKIGNYAFEECTSLKNISISNSIKSIGDRAFNGCVSLANITIPSDTTDIYEGAFRNCTNLCIYVDENNRFFSSMDGILFNKDKTALIQANDKCVTSKYAIPNSVTKIGAYAFSSCVSLIDLIIPRYVSSIGYGAFSCCDGLYITVEDDNYYYSSLEGVLFDKYKETLIKASDKSVDYNYIIPSSVTQISYSAFENCKSLTNITIPNSVTSIGISAFYNCSSLESVMLPISVTTIESLAFSCCTSLKNVIIPNSLTKISFSAFDECENILNVYYGGDEEQWNNISIKFGNDSICDAKIHYNYVNYMGIGKCGDNLSWTLDDEGTLTISGNGDMWTWYSVVSLPWYHYQDFIKNVVIKQGVTSIGGSAFHRLESITSVTIPKSVTYIIDWAFNNCSGLSNVYYKGTEEMWNNITIYPHNDSLLNANIHYQTYAPGDLTSDDTVDIDDAIILFQHTMMPDIYPLDSYAGDLDFNNDGEVDIDDAILIFQHSMMPDIYPIG